MCVLFIHSFREYESDSRENVDWVVFFCSVSTSPEFNSHYFIDFFQLQVIMAICLDRICVQIYSHLCPSTTSYSIKKRKTSNYLSHSHSLVPHPRTPPHRSRPRLSWSSPRRRSDPQVQYVVSYVEVVAVSKS